MRILLLSNSASEHTQKWAKGLASLGVEVGIFSLNSSDPSWYKDHKGIKIVYEPKADGGNTSLSSKLGYLKNVKKLRRCVDSFKPDILHAHYATSYGLLGKLSRFKPFVISVWGADVYDFPQKNPAFKLLLKKILSSATAICSTSNSMKQETQKYTDKNINVIPFGIDPAYFEVLPEKKESITIGLIKSLESKYGIDILIKAFDQIQKKYPQKAISLLLVGDGSKKGEYIELSKALGISDKVKFTGKVPHKEVINYHAAIDIFVSLSVLDSESFGVSLVESMAMGKPVVASDVSGFKEVLGEPACGIIVPRNSVEGAVTAISRYIDEPEFADKMGKMARFHAREFYNWNDNLKQMLNVYDQLLRNK